MVKLATFLASVVALSALGCNGAALDEPAPYSVGKATKKKSSKKTPAADDEEDEDNKGTSKSKGTGSGTDDDEDGPTTETNPTDPDPDTKPPAGGGGETPEPPPDPKKVFTPVYQQLKPTCASCHLNGTGPTFFGATEAATYDSFQLKGFAARTSPLLTKGAHAGPALTTQQRAALTAWITAEN